MPDSFGFKYANGTMGSFSFFQAGVVFPKINNSFSIGLSARICSSLTWATFINMGCGFTRSPLHQFFREGA